MTFQYYDVERVIKLVEARPCLWDNSNEFFKNKLIRHKAWIEIYHILEDKYEELSNYEKKQVGVKITTKWVNIRDAFFKSLKAKIGRIPKKKYIYANQLQFLLKHRKKENNTKSMNLEIKKERQDEDYLIPPDVSTNDTVFVNKVQSPLLRTPKNIKMSTKKLDDSGSYVPEELENSTHDPLSPTMNYDDKFFQSFVPYIKDMTENERIELQMDILNSIKKIKDNRSQSYTFKVTSQVWTTPND